MTCLEFLEQGCGQLGIDLSPAQLNALCRYYQELAKWSKKMNLVAKAGMKEILASHFLDSLTLQPHLAENNFRLLDIGTGAGFPGLALKVVCPQMQLTLVEPRTKRVSFLRHIIRTLDLSDVRVVAERLEADNKEQLAGLGDFDVVTSRALANLEIFLPLVEAYCAEEGQVICMKGPKAQEEHQEWLTSHPQSCLELVATLQYILPETAQSRQLMIFEKK